MRKSTKLFLAALAMTASVGATAQDEVVYSTSGYDVKNQKQVNFKWSTDEGFLQADAPAGENLSATAYRKGSDLYTVLTDGEKLTLSVMDAESFEQKSQQTSPLKGSFGVPQGAAYDDQRYTTYAISSEVEEGLGEHFYLGVLDEQGALLKRVATIGYWYDDESLTSIAPLSLYMNYGSAYITYVKRQGGQQQFRLGRVDLASGVLTDVGRYALDGVDKDKAVVSMFYNSTAYAAFLAISPDGEQNTAIYKAATNLSWNATDDVLDLDKQADANSVLASCYQRPSTITVYGSNYPAIALPDDLKIGIDGTQITISFTVPKVDVNGDELALQDWVTQDYNKAVNFYFYLDNSTITVTKPEGVTNYFPGDEVKVTADLGAGAVYNLSNPNGLHCFTVALNPANGYSNSSNRTSAFALVGGVKPTPVGSAKAEKTGQNSATFSWTAPTATEYADWGYDFDATGLTYKIVRNSDGTVVAEGITGLSADVDGLAKEPGDFDFSIIAVNNGTESAAAQTNAVYCEPPTYDFFGYNLDTKKVTAFNLDEAFTHTEWADNSDIGRVGFTRGGKLYTMNYNFSQTQWSAYGSQAFNTFTAEQFEKQGYGTTAYWYPSNGQRLRQIISAYYDQSLGLAYGIAVDSVKNAAGEVTALQYFVCNIDTINNYTAQYKQVSDICQWPLDGESDGKAVLSVAFFDGYAFATVLTREGGKTSYQFCEFNPMTLDMEPYCDFDLQPDVNSYQFLFSSPEGYFLGFNDGENPTVLYSLDPEEGDLEKVLTMDGRYSYAYRRPSLTEQPAQVPASFAVTAELDAETGLATLSFTVPTAETENTAATVRVLQDGAAIRSVGAVETQLGEAVTIENVPVDKGLHALTVFVQPADRNIATVNGAAVVISGPAMPNAVTNAAAEMFGDNEANITWTAPTASFWADFGGKIAEDDVLTYIVVQNQEGTTLTEDCEDLEFYAEEVASETGTYDFTVYAVNGGLVGPGAVTNTVDVTVATAIAGTHAQVVRAEAIYNEAGVRTDRMQKGLNIIRTTDGRTMKVVK